MKKTKPFFRITPKEISFLVAFIFVFGGGLFLFTCYIRNQGEAKNLPRGRRTPTPTATVVASTQPTASPTATAKPQPSPTIAPANAGITLINNATVYPEPTLPAKPAAGGKVQDPTFKTTILRLTDETDGNSSCQVQYSYWPSFNLNSTWVQAVCTVNGVTRTRLYTFDPQSFTATSAGYIATPPPSGWLMERSDQIWSGKDPLTLFGHNDLNKLWAYNVSTKAYTLIRDFSGDVLSGGHLYQMSKSTDDDTFAFSLNDSTGKSMGYLVWKKSTNAVVLRQTVATPLDEVQIDKSGRYLVVKTNDKAGVYNRIWDLSSMTSKDMYYNSSDRPFNHSDNGNGGATVASPWAPTIEQRTFSDFTLKPTLVNLGAYSNSPHVSSLADNEKWSLISTISTPAAPVTRAYEQEIFQVATDGSRAVRRIAHHGSVYSNYNDSPRANISRDGAFVAFTSNWGSAGGRIDVYIVQIPPAP